MTPSDFDFADIYRPLEAVAIAAAFVLLIAMGLLVIIN